MSHVDPWTRSLRLSTGVSRTLHTKLTLDGKRGLVAGIANDQSIASGCAMAFRELGADLEITYLNEKAEPQVRSFAERLGAGLILLCDVCRDIDLERVFEAIWDRWGRLGFLLHFIAFAPQEDLHVRVVDGTKEGFPPFLHPHGEASRAAHAEWRLPADSQLLRGGAGG